MTSPYKPRFLELSPGDKVELDKLDVLPERVHVFNQASITAVNAALAARRPLLIRGEPGSGKSQLARAVAKKLKRPYLHHVVDSQCESRDLLWSLDSVQRLADAQLEGALGCSPESEDHEASRKALRDRLAVKNYLRPGPLWWAFDWELALEHNQGVSPSMEADAKPENGCVVLLDEIDKAEMDVPNGLLEALGDRQFTPPGLGQAVVARGVSPLVILTTNEERALPHAFLRRCLVLKLDLFAEGEDEVLGKTSKDRLMKLGEAHFKGLNALILEKAADLLIKDRNKRKAKHLHPLPGVAEYLDLLRVVYTRTEDPKEQEKMLTEVSAYVVCKASGNNQ
jgi:MoxR-like ATPase